MKKNLLAVKRSAVAALVCSLLLLAGCSYKVLPKSIPPIKEFEALSLKDASLIVTNSEKNSSEYVILTGAGGKSALRTNRQVWSTLLVETLASELAKRGARVTSRAKLTLSLALPEITFTQTRDLSTFKVKVAVSSSAGWSKNYEVVAESGMEGIETATAQADRLAGQALAEAVKALLGDAEFLKQLGANG